MGIKNSKPNHRWSRKARHNRIYKLVLAATVAMGVLLLRLGWLQAIDSKRIGSAAAHVGHDLQLRSIRQREQEITIDTGRGHFVDRNGLRMTGRIIQGLAMFPLKQQSRGEPSALSALAAVLGTDAQSLENKLEGLREPEYWKQPLSAVPYALSEDQIASIGRLQVNGVKILPYMLRYEEGAPGNPLIGYISQHPERVDQIYADQIASGKMDRDVQIGGAGLERSLDRLLHGTGKSVVSHYTNGKQEPLKGLDIRLEAAGNPYYPLEVRTTLNHALQHQIEAYVASQGLREGAVVVLDARNADIVAMVSMPSFAANTPGELEEALANHAVRAVAPGSIFKLVTMAAALDAGITDEREHFHCSGHYGRYGLHCWKKGGHGDITLQEGLAHSCNVVFATLAERLSGVQLQQTAAKLGIGRAIGWQSEHPPAPLPGPLRLLQEEEDGRVFHPATGLSPADGGVMAQTGIGQRDVTVSPLQAANLIVTLLNHGNVHLARPLTEINYANGQQMAKLPIASGTSEYGSIRPSTAAALLRGMELTVQQGTGRRLNGNQWRVAGKSGTAQVMKDGAELNHQWFIGYGPVDKPQYAVAVLSKHRPSNSTNQATALFGGVMDLLARHGGS